MKIQVIYLSVLFKIKYYKILICRFCIDEKRIVISIAFCDFALWNFDSENFGLVFPKFSFFEAK